MRQSTDPVPRRRAGAWLVAPGRNTVPALPAVLDGFVVGSTQPTWANSGCRVAVPALTRNATKELKTTSDGQVITGLDLYQGSIQVWHRNVTIRDCVIRVGPPEGKDPANGRNFAIITRPSVDTSGLRIEHVTIDPSNAGPGGTADDAGVYGIQVSSSALIWRCAVRKVTDTLANVATSPMYVYGNYFATRWLAVDNYAQGGGETHNDGVQIAGGAGHRIVGNTIASCDSDGLTPKAGGNGVVATPYMGLIDDITVARNWFVDGGSQVSVWPRYNEGGPAITNVEVYGNRHSGMCGWGYVATPATIACARRWEPGTVTGSFKDQRGTTLPDGATVQPAIAANTGGTKVPS